MLIILATHIGAQPSFQHNLLANTIHECLKCGVQRDEIKSGDNVVRRLKRISRYDILPIFKESLKAEILHKISAFKLVLFLLLSEKRSADSSISPDPQTE